MRNINPHSLHKLLGVAMIASAAVVLLSAGIGLQQVFHQNILANSAHTAELFSRWLATHPIAKHLGEIDEHAADKAHFAPDQLEMLDTSVKPALISLGIIKIKVFDLEGHIVYSTERSIIGKENPGNPRLRKALNGDIDPSLESKEEFTDLGDETRFDVDIVETYAPIRNSQGAIIGAFEIYEDATEKQLRLYKSISLSLAILAGTLLLVFSFAYRLARTASQQISQVQDQLSEQATKDYLTGLFNHGEILRQAKSQFSLYTRHQVDHSPPTLSVIMLDLDDFKSINDTYGHQVGDQILSQSAERMRSKTREYNSLGRYGGEEFLQVLPATDVKGAAQAAERIRHSLCDAPFETDGGSLAVTASLGVSSMQPGDTDIHEIIRRADEALYAAKHAGKNTVRVR